jgi:hypothetical protein
MLVRTGHVGAHGSGCTSRCRPGGRGRFLMRHGPGLVVLLAAEQPCSPSPNESCGFCDTPGPRPSALTALPCTAASSRLAPARPAGLRCLGRPCTRSARMCVQDSSAHGQRANTHPAAAAHAGAGPCATLRRTTPKRTQHTDSVRIHTRQRRQLSTRTACEYTPGSGSACRGRSMRDTEEDHAQAHSQRCRARPPAVAWHRHARLAFVAWGGPAHAARKCACKRAQHTDSVRIHTRQRQRIPGPVHARH